jgi:hypothetical protein
MPASTALLGGLLCLSISVLSALAVIKTIRTGRLRLFLWPIAGWGERERSPTFFKLGIAGNICRTALFLILTIVFCAFFLEAVGILH